MEDLFNQIADIVRPAPPVKPLSDLDIVIMAKFKNLSNRALVERINRLPDFKWDDEGHELQRRINASNGKFAAKMQGNNIVILKNEK